MGKRKHLKKVIDNLGDCISMVCKTERFECPIYDECHKTSNNPRNSRMILAREWLAAHPKKSKGLAGWLPKEGEGIKFGTDCTAGPKIDKKLCIQYRYGYIDIQGARYKLVPIGNFEYRLGECTSIPEN